ncbi:ABC transporter substrate-binding protein [Acidisphaera sp. L21]|uniref:ABC transporter substrate-binding protein n=1 Tax=Acidisphaera sp. L21 TaxID=1641851 RepID=UPI00131BA306|nr:ABC transporter substrate-binding protein [Acidisphaera sp. L21]
MGGKRLLMALAICGSHAAWAAGPPIELGMISSLSGPIGDQGSEYANGAKLAAEAINRDGGIAALDHRPVHLNVVDDTSIPSVTRTLAIKLISSDKVPVILGPFASGPCMAAAPVGEQQQRALICSAASDQVTQQGYRYVFNRATLAGTFTYAGFRVLDGLSKSSGLDLKKVAVIYEDGAYGTSGNAQATKAAADAGVTITDRIAFHTNTADLSPVVNRAVASGAKALLLMVYTGDGVNIVRAVRTAKAPVLILGSGAWDSTMVKMGPPADGMVALSDWNEDVAKPAVAGYREAYKKAYGDYPGPSAAWGWSDMYFLKAALEEAKSLDPKTIRDTLAKLKTKDDPGLAVEPFNSYGFDDDGLAIGQVDRVIATQLQNGKFVTIWPEAVATAKLDTSTLK